MWCTNGSGGSAASGDDNGEASDEDSPSPVASPAGGPQGGGTAEEAAVAALDRCLRRPWKTKRKIGRFFRKYAADENEDGARALSLKQSALMAPELAEDFYVPAWLFNDLTMLYERFDFDGDGLLEKYECEKMVKYVLRQRRTELGGRPQEINVPYATLGEEGYTVIKELGRGGQGAMYLCNKRLTRHKYCVKFYNKEHANACGLHELIDEYELMKELASQHIAQTYQVFQDNEFYYLVNEPYYGGDLTKLAKRAFSDGVSMNEAWWRPVFSQCFSGLGYLHRKAIMHCDIKEPNIMIASGDSYQAPRVVLIDFGLSMPFSKAGKGISGTPGYIPPETWQTGAWFPQGDIFSLGIVVFQLMTGQVPSANGSVMGVLQPSADPQQLQRAGVAAQLPWQKFPANMPEFMDLVVWMTQRERKSRPRVPQALQHEWFHSDAHGELPAATLEGLVGVAAGHGASDLVVQALSHAHNLNELRVLRHDLEQQEEGAEDGTTSSPLGLAARRVKAILTRHGINRDAKGSRGRLAHMVDEAIKMKEQYSHQYIKDVFEELDKDRNGRLSPRELEALLDTDAFECHYDDIKELVARMGTDRQGLVPFENFRAALLEDGRIARRSSVEGERWSCSAS